MLASLLASSKMANNFLAIPPGPESYIGTAVTKTGLRILREPRPVGRVDFSLGKGITPDQREVMEWLVICKRAPSLVLKGWTGNEKPVCVEEQVERAARWGRRMKWMTRRVNFGRKLHGTTIA